MLCHLYNINGKYKLYLCLQFDLTCLWPCRCFICLDFRRAFNIFCGSLNFCNDFIIIIISFHWYSLPCLAIHGGCAFPFGITAIHFLFRPCHDRPIMAAVFPFWVNVVNFDILSHAFHLLAKVCALFFWAVSLYYSRRPFISILGHAVTCELWQPHFFLLGKFY